MKDELTIGGLRFQRAMPHANRYDYHQYGLGGRVLTINFWPRGRGGKCRVCEAAIGSKPEIQEVQATARTSSSRVVALRLAMFFVRSQLQWHYALPESATRHP